MKQLIGMVALATSLMVSVAYANQPPPPPSSTPTSQTDTATSTAGATVNVPVDVKTAPNAATATTGNQETKTDSNSSASAKGGSGTGTGVGTATVKDSGNGTGIGKGGAGGAGGGGGSVGSVAGGSVGPLTTTAGSTATTGPVSTGPATATTGPSSASISGNGSTFNTTTNSKNLVFVPVQPAELPPTIAVGGIHLEKAGGCRARITVAPFKRQTNVPIVAGLWSKGIDMPTMHGLLTGFDEKNPFIVRRDTVPQLVDGKFVDGELVTVYGHQLYLSVEQIAQGGGGSSAANYANEKAWGGGLSLSANTAFGVIGVVAVPCEYDVEKGLPKKETPVVAVPDPSKPDPRDQKIKDQQVVITDQQEIIKRQDKAIHNDK